MIKEMHHFGVQLTLPTMDPRHVEIFHWMRNQAQTTGSIQCLTV
jgi:hypothetical protein